MVIFFMLTWVSFGFGILLACIDIWLSDDDEEE